VTGTVPPEETGGPVTVYGVSLVPGTDVVEYAVVAEGSKTVTGVVPPGTEGFPVDVAPEGMSEAIVVVV